MRVHQLGAIEPDAPDPAEPVYAIDAGALVEQVAQLDCPLCEHAIGVHAMGGPCQACSCNGVLTFAIVEPDE